MPDSKHAKTEYFRVQNAWVLDKFTQDELALLISKGSMLFKKMDLTDEAEQFLEDFPELKQVIDKW